MWTIAADAPALPSRNVLKILIKSVFDYEQVKEEHTNKKIRTKTKKALMSRLQVLWNKALQSNCNALSADSFHYPQKRGGHYSRRCRTRTPRWGEYSTPDGVDSCHIINISDDRMKKCETTVYKIKRPWWAEHTNKKIRAKTKKALMSRCLVLRNKALQSNCNALSASAYGGNTHGG